MIESYTKMVIATKDGVFDPKVQIAGYGQGGHAVLKTCLHNEVMTRRKPNVSM